MAHKADPAQIRDAVDSATDGKVLSWIALHDIVRLLGLTDAAACQGAVRRAADAGWIATGGDREVRSVSITYEGHRLARGRRSRRRNPPPEGTATMSPKDPATGCISEPGSRPGRQRPNIASRPPVATVSNSLWSRNEHKNLRLLLHR